jgi:hypothetical protein
MKPTNKNLSLSGIAVLLVVALFSCISLAQAGAKNATNAPLGQVAAPVILMADGVAPAPPPPPPPPPGVSTSASLA